MKTLMSALLLVLGSLSFAAHAADAATCEAQATEKKLAGAAKASFLKKCTADAKGGAKAADAAASEPPAKTACESQAADKKLSGAARTSFLKKCKADAAKK
jgi:hypothetical protein